MNRKIPVTVPCDFDNEESRKSTKVSNGSRGGDNASAITFPQIDLSRESQTINGNGLVTACVGISSTICYVQACVMLDSLLTF